MAVLDVREPQLRERVSQALSASGVSPTADSADGDQPVILVTDASTAREDARVVRLWRNGRSRDTWQGDALPFADASVWNWIGVEPDVDSEVLGSTVNHLAAGTYLTLSHLLDRQAHIETAEETCSSAKACHLQRLRDFCSAAGVPKHIHDDLDIVLDELFTNAVYDAPVGSNGEHVNAAVERSRAVVSDRPFLIQFGVDQRHVGVAVRDSFGSLKPARVISVLQRCFDTAGAVIEDKRGGAGLGIFFLLQNANRLVININPGQFTEIVVLRALAQRKRDFRKSCPTLNLYAPIVDDRHKDSRQFYRVPVDWDARVQHDGVELAGTVLDVSVAGAFVQAPPGAKTLLVGDSVEIEILRGPGESVLRVTAKVRWCGRSARHGCDGFGVAFDEKLGTPILYSNFSRCWSKQ